VEIIFKINKKLGDFLQKFHSIAERIAKLEPAVAWNRNTVDDLTARRMEFLSPPFKVRDQVSHMSFCTLAFNAVLGTKMYLNVAKLQPKPAASGKRRGFCDLFKTHYSTVEGTSGVLGRNRNADLDVVDSDHLFAQFFAHT
jgi:hypothetical protein